MPTLRELLCKSETQRAFIERGAAALSQFENVQITPALIGDIAVVPPKTFNSALKPADVVKEELPKPEAAWGRVAGFFQQLATFETSPAVLTFAVLCILLVFPQAATEVREVTPANYAPFFEGNSQIPDITTRFEIYLTGTLTSPAKLPVQILAAELQLFRRLTPPLLQ